MLSSSPRVLRRARLRQGSAARPKSLLVRSASLSRASSSLARAAPISARPTSKGFATKAQKKEKKENNDGNKASGNPFQYKISAAQCPAPPFTSAIIYNQSKHACQSVLADLRAVWGNKVRVLQVVERGEFALPGTDGAMFIEKKTWGDMEHFGERLDSMCALDNYLSGQRKEGQVVFMPGWSAFAESPVAARAVTALGLVWPGTEPVASQKLEKIGFKQICQKVGAPTPPFVVLSEEGVDDEVAENLADPEVKEAVIEKYMAVLAAMDTTQPGLLKSVHGGGGKGTALLSNPSDPDLVRAAIEKILNEMHRSDGIYFEEKVNTDGDGSFLQLELEVDGTDVAHGGRFVWFNSRLQKVVEIGLSDTHVSQFMPEDLYLKAREWSRQIATMAGNNTRATMEALVFEDAVGQFQLQFIECNRRPQVENEALALLQQDSSGNRRYTFAELMMRAAGHPAPAFEPNPGVEVVLHARWLHGNPDHEGNIAYQAGNVVGMSGPRLDWVASEALAPGEISFTADPQLGKAVIVASSWEQMCSRGALYFQLRQPNIQGSNSTYAQTMRNLFKSQAFRSGTVASNATFAALEIPEYPKRSLSAVLQDQVTPIIVKGYRPGEGIDPDDWPTARACDRLRGVSAGLSQVAPRETVFTKYARGELSYDAYMADLKGKLSDQGGAWVTVAPRDTMQQGNDSESAGVNELSRRNAEVWAERAGCVGYETGGAQYQAALIRDFDPASVLRLGLPYNLPAHSLQRSQYVNGLAELPSSIRQPLFDTTAQLVSTFYQRPVEAAEVPWFPYNFHAGNYINEATGYSPQNETTAELLKAQCCPIPTWVFSPKFPLSALGRWVPKQIELFEASGRELQQIRIKNPGQGKDWTADAVWDHIQTIREVFAGRGMPSPVIYVHNHDFNGQGAHIAKELFLRSQSSGDPNLVIDGAYRKNGTHNDNTVMLSGLNISQEQKEALIEYNHVQQTIENVVCRFDSRTSQMTPWDSDWAGGTEGSDLRIAKEYGLDPRQINSAKEVASEVFPLERAVTPFSEYKLRLGIAIMIEDAIQPKSVEAVKKFVDSGGRLKVGADVLVGLKKWESIVKKPKSVDQLLSNMREEVSSALQQNAKLIGPKDLPEHFSPSDRFNALGFQQKGMDFIRRQGQGVDLTPLLVAPHVLHRKPQTLPAGCRFSLLLESSQSWERTKLDFLGFGRAPNGDLTVSYRHKGEIIVCTHEDPDAVKGVVADSGPRKADASDIFEMGTDIPGELLAYDVAVGDILEAGKPLCVMESMKMEIKISVPDSLDGFQVKALSANTRTAELQGDVLSPGDLILETKVVPAE